MSIVTDPLRVLVIDPDVVSRAALGRVVDRDPDLAIVGLCGDLRRAAADAERCGPDVIAIRLSMDDPRCTDLLDVLGSRGQRGCVLVLGQPGPRDLSVRDAERMRDRIKAVGRGVPMGPSAPQIPPVAPVSVGRLH